MYGYRKKSIVEWIGIRVSVQQQQCINALATIGRTKRSLFDFLSVRIDLSAHIKYILYYLLYTDFGYYIILHNI